jgi:hypothetical protein
MSGSQVQRVRPWRRRPRRPLPALLQDWRVWPGLVILWLVAVVGGGVYAATDGPWWGRVTGGAALVVGLVGPVWFVVYARRPVVDDRFDPEATWVRDEIDAWHQELARSGRVEIGLSVRRLVWTALIMVVILVFSVALVLGLTDVFGRVIGVVCLLVLVPLGVIPHLEYATARGPALRVDTVGIRIARWHPVEMPWSEIVGAHLYATGRGSSVMSQNTIVYVTPDWYESYQQRRPFIRRAADRVGSHYTRGPSFTIPYTIGADAFPLSLWLDDEIRRHHPSVRSDDQEPG